VEFSRLCAASYRQIVESGHGGIGIALQRPNRIPQLRPRIQTKVALRVASCEWIVANGHITPFVSYFRLDGDTARIEISPPNLNTGPRLLTRQRGEKQGRMVAFSKPKGKPVERFT
jgi:hypothetical protein